LYKYLGVLYRYLKVLYKKKAIKQAIKRFCMVCNEIVKAVLW